MNNSIPAFRDPNEVYIPPAPLEQCSVWGDFPWGFHRGVACSLQMIRDILARAGIQVTADDPPVPGMLFSLALAPSSSGGTSARVSATATHATAPITATFVVSHTVLSGTFSAEWTTDARIGAQFITLTVPWAQVYDGNNALIAEGAVVARPLPCKRGRGRGGCACARRRAHLYRRGGTSQAQIRRGRC